MSSRSGERWVVAAVVVAGAVLGGQSEARGRFDTASQVAAEQLLMFTPEPLDGSVAASGGTLGQRQLWSSTVGALGANPEQVFSALFGKKGKVRARDRGRAIELSWRSSGRVRPLGRVVAADEGFRFEPEPSLLRRRNAVVGRLVLAQIRKLEAKGALVSRVVKQPASWVTEPAKMYRLSDQQPNLLHQLAASGSSNPLIKGLAPMPETHFVMPEGTSASERHRLERDWKAWQGEVKQGSDNVALAGKVGHVRPLNISWRDQRGRHNLQVRGDLVGGRLVRAALYQHAARTARGPRRQRRR